MADEGYPHAYKAQRGFEKEALMTRKRQLAEGLELPPVCGFTYSPRRNRNTSIPYDPAPVVCMRNAGAGTTHHGKGFCDYHEVQQEKELARKGTQVAALRQHIIKENTFLGNPIPTDPHTAFMDEIARTAGLVEWLRERMIAMAEAGENELSIVREYSPKLGYTKSVLMELYQDERQHLVRTCAAAIKAGVAERRVQIAEQQGRIIAAMMMAFIHDKELGLSPEQIMKAPTIIRHHLSNLPQAAEHPAGRIIEATTS